jgi:hypothetical protein
MPQYDVPCDILMCNQDNVERGTGRFHHQTVDYSNTDRAEPGFDSKAKANVERPIPYHARNACRIIGVSGMVSSPVSSRMRAPLMMAAGGSISG